MIRSLMAIVVLLLAAFLILATGCGSRLQMTGKSGCKTVDELIERCRDAHQRKDMKALRSICFWNVQRSSWAGPYEELEDSIRDIFAHFPFDNVEYIEGPLPDPELGGQVIYYIPGVGREDYIVGPVYGKLVLLGAGQERLDPSYVVMKFDQYDGRYYIDAAPLVLIDAARSVRENVRPRYVGASLEPTPDLRKGERERKFP